MFKQKSGEDVAKSSITSFAKGEIFTFIVGHEKTRYQVHVEALKAISDPLGYMMTNGQMEESISGEAALPEVEPDIFEQLIKFAYLGLCGMSDGLAEDAIEQTIHIRCHKCGRTCDTQIGRTYPYCSTECQRKYHQDLTNGGKFVVYCAQADCGNSFFLNSSSSYRKNPLCNEHSSDQSSRAEHPDKNDGALSKHNSFFSLQYGTSKSTHDQLCKLLDSHRDDKSTAVALIFHAKLYVIAGQYLIKDLQQICLHKLRRHIANTSFTTGKIDELVDLLTFTYSNTEDGGDILQDKNDPLRRLVMRYIATHSDTLLQFSGFREVLCAGGSHTADFVALKFT